MKKCLVAGLVSSLVLVSLQGCGETAPELTAEQQVQLRLAEIEAQKEIKLKQLDAEIADDIYDAQEAQYLQEAGYSQGQDQPTVVSNPTSDVQSGYSGGDMVLGALAGAAAGYAISSSLNNGYSSYTDNTGREYYKDSKGNHISADEYNKASKKYGVKERFKSAAKTIKGKSSDAYQKIKSSNTSQKLKQKAKAGYQKTKTTASLVKEKAKPKFNQVKKKTNNFYKKAKSKVKSYSRSRSRGRR